MAGESFYKMPPAGFTTQDVTCPFCDCALKLTMQGHVDMSSAVNVEKKRCSTDAVMGRPEDNPVANDPAKTRPAQSTTSPPLEPPPPVKSEAEPPSGHMVGYKHSGIFFECLACEQEFTEEFSCWQHIVSKPDCHQEPDVLAAVQSYVNSPRKSKKKR